MRTGRPVALDAMSATERKVVHEHLRDREDVETYSEGNEPDRHLVVAPLDGCSVSVDDDPRSLIWPEVRGAGGRSSRARTRIPRCSGEATRPATVRESADRGTTRTWPTR